MGVAGRLQRPAGAAVTSRMEDTVDYTTCRRTVLTAVLVMALAASATAQTPATPAPPAQPAAPAEPPPPPPPWTGSIGAGLALTAGNSDTFNINVSFDLSSNPKARNVMKAEGLYLRGDKDDELAVDRTSVKLRDEYGLSPRAYVFGQLEYLRDTFKNIQYLWAPTGGVGYKVIDLPQTTFSVDGGVGLVIEKNPFLETRTSGAVSGGEDFVYKFSEVSSFTQAFDALWVMDDFGDALYTFKAGVAGAITRRATVKVELVNSYKTKPPDALTKKNDVALVTAIVYKF
jgi:putative salt-induced outer membrane protein YdiY